MEKIRKSQFCVKCKTRKDTSVLMKLRDGNYQCRLGIGCNKTEHLIITKGADGYCYKCDQMVCICGSTKKKKAAEQEHQLFEDDFDDI